MDEILVQLDGGKGEKLIVVCLFVSLYCYLQQQHLFSDYKQEISLTVSRFFDLLLLQYTEGVLLKHVVVQGP